MQGMPICLYSHKASRETGSLKALAIALYGHGLSFRTIGSLFSVRSEAVRLWVETFASQLQLSTPTEALPVLELDEMWHFIQKKSTSSGYGKPLLILLGNSWDSLQAVAIPKQQSNF